MTEEVNEKQKVCLDGAKNSFSRIVSTLLSIQDVNIGTQTVKDFIRGRNVNLNREQFNKLNNMCNAVEVAVTLIRNKINFAGICKINKTMVGSENQAAGIPKSALGSGFAVDKLSELSASYMSQLWAEAKDLDYTRKLFCEIVASDCFYCCNDATAFVVLHNLLIHQGIGHLDFSNMDINEVRAAVSNYKRGILGDDEFWDTVKTCIVLYDDEECVAYAG